ncbi:MAG: AsmA-like C-terminal region-containing protein [Bacteroidia bacterium]
MKKIFKIIIILTAVIVIALIALYSYIRSNRDEIHTKIVTSMRDKLHARVEFDKMDFSFFESFPYLSIELTKVLIADSLFTIYKTPLLSSKKLSLQTNFWSILTLSIDIKKIVIEQSSLQIYTCSNGYSNKYILDNLSKKDSTAITKKKSKSKAEFNIEQIRLTDVMISIKDSIKAKAFGFNFQSVICKLNQTATETNAYVEGTIFIEGLAFNQLKGTYLNRQPIFLKTHLKINSEKGFIEILPSTLNIQKAHFDLSGSISSKDKDELKLVLHNDAFLLIDAKNILTKHIYSKLEKYSFLGPMTVDAVLRTPLKGSGSDPHIEVKARAQKIPVSISGFDIDTVSFDAVFKNFTDAASIPCDENSTIVFQNFSANASGLKIKGFVKIIDLKDTKIDVDLKGAAPLQDLQNFVNENSLELKSGMFNLNLKLQANVVQLYDSISKKINGTADGELVISDGIIFNKQKDLELKNINFRLNLNPAGTHSVNLSLKAPGSDFVLTGEVEELVAFLVSQESIMTIRAKAVSNSLNFEPLLAGKPETTVAPPKKKKKLEQDVASSIDRFLTHTQINTSINVKRAYFRKFNAYNLTGNMFISNGKASLSDFNFEHAHGKIKYTASIENTNQGFNASFKSSVINLSMPEFMEAFENFNQESLTGKNIKGNISLDINASCATNSNLVVIPGSMKGNLKLNIRNGELNNFQPLVNLSKHIFKNRSLDSVRFSTINGAADLMGTEIELHKMIILSSAISLAVDGIYSFGDKTDLSIQVPLKNIKSTSPEYFSSIEKFNNYNGANIYIRGKTKDNKIAFSYDPFKKGQKKKK